MKHMSDWFTPLRLIRAAALGVGLFGVWWIIVFFQALFSFIKDPEFFKSSSGSFSMVGDVFVSLFTLFMLLLGLMLVLVAWRACWRLNARNLKRLIIAASAVACFYPVFSIMGRVEMLNRNMDRHVSNDITAICLLIAMFGCRAAYRWARVHAPLPEEDRAQLPEGLSRNTIALTVIFVFGSNISFWVEWLFRHRVPVHFPHPGYAWVGGIQISIMVALYFILARWLAVPKPSKPEQQGVPGA